MTTPSGGEWRPQPVRRIGEASEQGRRRARQPMRPDPFDSQTGSDGRQVLPPAGLLRRSAAPDESSPDRAVGTGRGISGLIVLLIAALAVAVVIVLFFEPGLVDTSFNTDSSATNTTSSTQVVRPLVPVQFEARLVEDLPPIPDVLGVVSPVYELRVPSNRLGPFDLTLALSTPTQDVRNLGVYTWDGDDWIRLNDAIVSSDGGAARITLNEVPDNLVVLRRLQFRDVIAGRVPHGEEPQDELAGSLTLVHPDGWQPGEDGSLLGSVELLAPSITPNVWPTIYSTPDQAELVNDIMASDNLRRQHIANIQHGILSGRYDGVDIHYLDISPALRTQFTSFVSELADRLHRDDRGLSVHIPINAAGGVGEGAYDLTQLGAAADFVVIEAPLDPTLFQPSIDASLPTLLQRIEPNKLLLGLRSSAVVRTVEGYGELSQREALGIASDLSVREPGPFTPGRRVTLQGNSFRVDELSGGLRWDNVNRVVTFTYPDPTGTAVTIWIHNRFSAAFHLQVVSDWALGGVYVSNASADGANANLWPAIAAYFESGVPDLRLPNSILFDPVFSVEAGELSGTSSSGWQFWDLPAAAGDYRAQLVVSDGDVRVGHVITVPVRYDGAD